MQVCCVHFILWIWLYAQMNSHVILPVGVGERLVDKSEALNLLNRSPCFIKTLVMYRKSPKNSYTRKICCKHPKIRTGCLYHRCNVSKICRGNCKQCRP